MGNLMACCRKKSKPKPKPKPKPKQSSSSFRSLPGGKERASSRMNNAQQQAVAYILSQQEQNGHAKYERSFERSSSTRTNPLAGPTQGLSRSSSARPRSSKDPLLQPQHLISQDAKLSADLETKHFVLIHGGGFGAWCWYKTIALLEDTGFKATAIDLTGSGIDSTDPNKITSLAQYVKPLIEFFEKLGKNEKVILVGHDFGGACISFAMERFPSNVAKAVFISAAMVTNRQRTFDIFAQEVMEPDCLLRKAQIFIYANGNANPPTSIELDKKLLKDMLFNHSPAKDVALASVSMRPIPFAPFLEKLSLTERNYGSVRRFFIETSDDQAITPSIQENLIKLNSPEQVVRVKGSDHSPFFSKPQALHKLLLEIAQ
ncbi:hypothetical protein KI387_019812, partial [Taxus chinensis]